jgi:stage II sporulation protein AA (anti-sigma F factor antagonist)
MPKLYGTTYQFPPGVAEMHRPATGAWMRSGRMFLWSKHKMQMDIAEFGPDSNRIVLEGRLDAAGAGAVELRFTASIAPVDRHAVVDLGAVPFVSSLGIRLLLSVARTMQRRGRKLVLLNPQAPVMAVFDTVALGTLIPIAADEAEAVALVRG